MTISVTLILGLTAPATPVNIIFSTLNCEIKSVVEIAALTGMALSTVYRYGTSFYKKLKQENLLKLKKEKEILKKRKYSSLFNLLFNSFGLID